ncbi:MAG TPA: SDR family NAD(P)-dependent oxidoreductase, partial [Chthonomonadaceae bacterium]|nr:SDR family NAD(P)-dependent oxidoreductase [Chthonomonadaceae bacterium]
MLLEGRVALVTGGGRGIGAAICRVLAREGAAVAVNYAHSADKAEAVVAAIAAAGGRARAFGADVRDRKAVDRMVAEVVAEFGRLDAVVNNAIAGRQHGPFDTAAESDFDDAYAFGCKAVIHTVGAARSVFQAQGGGRIVNIVTELWNLAPAQWTVYLAGKGAMVGLSRSLACELGPDNITVNMVAPGWMADEKVDLDSDGSKRFAES